MTHAASLSAVHDYPVIDGKTAIHGLAGVFMAATGMPGWAATVAALSWELFLHPEEEGHLNAMMDAAALLAGFAVYRAAQ